MDDIDSRCASLRAQIVTVEKQLASLKCELEDAEKTATILASRNGSQTSNCKEDLTNTNKWPLLSEEYKRYGRQMIVSEIGIHGQLKLQSSSVLIVGAGGLGCPAALYLAGAGIGTLGLVDGDSVEHSNLHRQVLHRSRNVGKLKVDSAIEYLHELNPYPKYVPYGVHLSPQNAPEIFKEYDVILDCTDNPATRYLISDTAVLLGKPVVSASALRTDGQLMVLNNPPKAPGDIVGGPCYRCVFPKPPPADSVVSCADGGILGPVVGTMGVLQSLEAIKLITRASFKHARNGAIATDEVVEPESHSLHIFSAYAYPPFRTIRLRSRRNNCAVCSAARNITLDTIRTGLTDYVRFCGSATSPRILSMQERISPAQLRSSLSLDPFTSPSSPPFQSPFSEADPYILIDVRDKTQYEICSLPKSVNIPISTFTSWTPPTVQAKTTRTSEKSLSGPTPGMSSPHPETSLENGKEDEQEWNKDLPEWLPQAVKSSHSSVPIYVVCRQGNDSQIVVQKLKEMGLDRNGERFIGDIQDGFRGWKREVDPTWPEY